MAVESPPKPAKATQPKEKPPEEPYEEDFWQRFSPHFEFPLANVASIVIHIIVFGLFMYYISRLLQVEDKTAVPIHGMVIDSDGGTGVGQAGSGGGQEEAKEANVIPQDKAEPLPQIELNRAMVAVSDWAPELANNPEALAVLADSPNRKKLEKLGESLKR